MDRPWDVGSRRLYYRPAGARWWFDPSSKTVKGSAGEFIDHLLQLQELADASGQTFEAFVEGPPADVAYAARAVIRIRRMQGWGKASHKKGGLIDLTLTLPQDAPTPLHAVIVAGLRDYAIKGTHSQGNPDKLLGATNNRARRVVNLAIQQLVAEALATEGGWPNYGWIFAAGGPGRPSSGHVMVVKRAGDLASAMGVEVTEASLRLQATEALRTVRKFGLLKWLLSTRDARANAVAERLT